ncbi:hypothetical protein KA005_22275, partial [bacterium]|nr:hypothetical protein [bacterium]
MKIIRLIVAGIFMFNFLLCDLAIAQPVEKLNITDGSTYISQFKFDDFELPYSAGDIKTKFKGDPGKTVVHIQDAHCNYACQHKISDIIDYLNAEYGVDTLDLEGGSGKYDLSLFTQIEAPETREKVTDYFVKTGLVSGAEYFAINNPAEVTLKGIENPELYYKNLNAYRDILPYEKEIKSLLSSLKKHIERLKPAIYSRQLKELDTLRKRYKKNEIEFKDYLVALLSRSDVFDINT